MRHTISIYNEELSSVINLQIGMSTDLHPMDGYFSPADNQIILGRDRWEEWNSYSGNSAKQRVFIEKLTKVYRKQIN